MLGPVPDEETPGARLPGVSTIKDDPRETLSRGSRLPSVPVVSAGPCMAFPSCPAHRAKAPDVTQELVLREDPIRVRRQCPEKDELLVGEWHLSVGDLDLAPRRIDEQVPDPPRTLPPGIAAPQ